MERLKIIAFSREKGSKGKNNQLRAKGLLPGVVYGRGGASRLVNVETAALKKALSTAGGMNVLLDLEIKGEDGAPVETVMIKELQQHPLKQDYFLHADLLRISLDQKLEVKVPLNFTGEPAGVIEGGLFQIQLREISVRCLPGEIPDSIEVSIDHLQIGDSLSIDGLELPPGLEIVDEMDKVVASVLAPQVEPIEEEEEAELEAEEGAAEAGEASPETPEEEESDA